MNALEQMRAKVAEHKELQNDPDYQLAKAAFTVLAVLAPKFPEPAWIRAKAFLMSVSYKAYHKAYLETKHLTPRRRWQDKEKAQQ